MHGSSVTGTQSLICIIWWLRRANQCWTATLRLSYDSTVFRSDSNLVVKRCPSLIRSISIAVASTICSTRATPASSSGSLPPLSVSFWALKGHARIAHPVTVGLAASALIGAGTAVYTADQSRKATHGAQDQANYQHLENGFDIVHQKRPSVSRG